ncbi:TRAP transporter small permease [Celeribacter sp.]|uniref:TRAP transporter small permease n=1 Tax=Celeribacter sp. TaxID=1890673 RepID=UPI003A8D6A2F
MPGTTKTPLLKIVVGKAELIVAGIAFVLMLSVIVLNVFLRYLFSTSVLSAEELAYLGFTWSTFAAVAWLYRVKALIAVDVFFAILPDGVQRVLSIIVNFSLIGANLWFCWLSWVLASGGWIRKTPVLEIPYFWVNLAPFLAFALMAFYSALHFIDGLRHPGPYGHDASHDAELYKETAL